MFRVWWDEFLGIVPIQREGDRGIADLAQSPSHPRKDDAGVVALLAVHWCSGDVLQLEQS